MSEIYIENEMFENLDYSTSFQIGEYENCTFENCNFSKSNISNAKFIDCEFISCDMSMMKCIDTAFREVNFNHCKMLGIDFEDCNKFNFEVSFDTCQLNHSTFFKVNLKNSIFSNTKLTEVDFTETNLEGSNFKLCDLTRAVFERTNLEKADLRTSENFNIDPELNSIRGAKFSRSTLEGLLIKYRIKVY